MAAPINLESLDTAILEQTNFDRDMKRWLSNIVDIINNNFNSLTETFQFLITSSGIDIGGSGVGPITVTVVGLTTSGYVNVNIVSTSNPGITISSVVPGNGSFQITFSGDPGASAIIVYQAFMQKPQ